jgi:hypothetical protein
VAPRVWASSTMRDGAVVEPDVASVIEARRYEPAIQRCEIVARLRTVHGTARSKRASQPRLLGSFQAYTL